MLDMRRTVVSGAIVLALLCGTAALAPFGTSSAQTSLIHALPLYPNARNVLYGGSQVSSTGLTSQGKQISRTSTVGGHSAAPNSDVLSFDASGNPQAVSAYYDAWFTAHGWSGQTYSQAQVQGASLLRVYSLDGSPDLARIDFLGFNGIIPKLYIRRSHSWAYVNVHPVLGTTSVEVRVYSVEY